jgi:hypothetical protein
MIQRWLLALALVAAASCSALNRPFGGQSGMSTPKNAEEAKAALAQAEQDFARGRTQRALDRAILCRDATGLPSEVRNETETAVERYAWKRIDELSVKGSKPGDLIDMVELNLPRTLAVRAGVRGAELWLEQGKPYKAFKALKKVDAKFPNHHERARAGELLAQAGLELANDDWSFLGMFKARDDGQEILEYLVVNYPKEKRCDEAYATLAKLYAQDREWELARTRCEDLLLYHTDSPLAAWAEAHVPHYRLCALRSPEYDRRELVRARGELEQWLDRHRTSSSETSSLEHTVRVDYADCLIRLCRSDLGVAQFYERIDQRTGAMLHADRAVEEAKTSGNAALLAEATQMAKRARALPAPAGGP